MTARNSAAAQAADMRARARRGVWQRLLAALGVRTGRVRRADAVAARWEHGAAGEAETARLVPTLAAAPKAYDPARAAAVAARVDRVLTPYIPGPRRVR